MAKGYFVERRDLNEGKLILKMQALEPGVVIVKMNSAQGYDLTVITSRWTESVEIKNPAESWELTPQEIDLKEHLEAIGRRLWVLETERDVISMWEMLP